MVIGRPECRDGRRRRAGCGRDSLIDLDVVGEPPNVSSEGRAAWRRQANAAMRMRSPISPQAPGADRAAGVRADGDVDGLPATAAAEPEDDPPGTRSGAANHRRGKMRVDPHQREGELVGLRLPANRAPCRAAAGPPACVPAISAFR